MSTFSEAFLCQVLARVDELLSIARAYAVQSTACCLVHQDGRLRDEVVLSDELLRVDEVERRILSFLLRFWRLCRLRSQKWVNLGLVGDQVQERALVLGPALARRCRQDAPTSVHLWLVVDVPRQRERLACMEPV